MEIDRDGMVGWELTAMGWLNGNLAAMEIGWMRIGRNWGYLD